MEAIKKEMVPVNITENMPLAELKGRKEFRKKTPKVWDKFLFLLSVLFCTDSFCTYFIPISLMMITISSLLLISR